MRRFYAPALAGVAACVFALIAAATLTGRGLRSASSVALPLFPGHELDLVVHTRESHLITNDLEVGAYLQVAPRLTIAFWYQNTASGALRRLLRIGLPLWPLVAMPSLAAVISLWLLLPDRAAAARSPELYGGQSREQPSPGDR